MNCSTLIDLIEGAGYAVQSYSGRGMYGASCVGFVIGGDVGMLRAMADIIDNMDIDMEDGNLYDFTAVMRSAKYDNMGLDTIIYFPRVKWVEED